MDVVFGNRNGLRPCRGRTVGGISLRPLQGRGSPCKSRSTFCDPARVAKPALNDCNPLTPSGSHSHCIWQPDRPSTPSVAQVAVFLCDPSGVVNCLVRSTFCDPSRVASPANSGAIICDPSRSVAALHDCNPLTPSGAHSRCIWQPDRPSTPSGSHWWQHSSTTPPGSWIPL